MDAIRTEFMADELFPLSVSISFSRVFQSAIDAVRVGFFKDPARMKNQISQVGALDCENDGFVVGSSLCEHDCISEGNWVAPGFV